MPETSARSRLKVEIGAEVAEAVMNLRVLGKSVEEFRKAAEKAGKTSIFPNPAVMEAQVRAGIKPIMDLRRQLAETMRDAKSRLSLATDPQEIDRLKLIIAQATAASQKIVQTMRQLKTEASAKSKASAIETISLQAKAGVAPLTKLRDEMVKTIRAKIALLESRADFINDPEILKDIVHLKQVKAEIDKVHQSLQQPVRNPFAGLGQALQQALLPLAGLTAGLTLALQQAASAAHTFDTQLRLISTISKQSGSELRALGDDILRASEALQTDAVELAAAQYEILSSGVEDSAEAFHVMEESAKLAKAGVGTAAEAADLLTSSLNALGGTPARNAEILFKTVELGKVKIGEMAEEFGGVAAQAAVAGVSLEEVAASTATLSLTGRNAAEGLTGIRAILTAVSKQAPEAVKFAKSIGLEFNTAAIRAKGFAGFIADVAKKTKGSDEAIAKLFGRVEGINTVLALGTVQAGQYADILERVRNSTGSLDEAFQRTLNPVDATIIAFKNLSITIGQNLTTALAAPLGALKDLFSLLREHKDLVAFGSGVAGVALALGALATAASAAAFVIGPLIPLLQGLASILAGGTFAAGAGAAVGSIALGPAIQAVAIAFVALAAAGGLFVQCMNRLNTAAEQAKKSVADLNSEIDSSTQSQIKAGKEFQVSAQKIDEIKKKTKLNKDEQLILGDSIKTLREHFSKYKIDLDELVSKYGNWTQAIRDARIQQTALDRETDLRKQLEKVQKARRQIGSPLEGVGEAGILFVDQQKQKQRASLDKQEEDLKNHLKNKKRIQDDARREVDLADARDREAAKLPGSLNIPDEAELDKIKNAREQLTKKLEALEVELTGFTAGEFEKRRADAERDHDDSIRQLQELGKTAKATQTEITKGINDADKLRDAKLAEINRQESQAMSDAKRSVKEIQANIQSLNAALTVGNPFDDITADAQKAAETIKREYALAVRSLEELVRKNPKLANIANETKTLLRQQFAASLQQNDIFNQQRKFEEERALLDLAQQNKVLQEEIAGDTLKIEQATNEKVIADLQFRIDNQKDILQNAIDALNKDPLNKNLQLGHQKAIDDLNHLQLEQEKAITEGSKREAALRSEGIKLVIEQLQQEIELYGQRPELLQKLIVAYSEYLIQLEKEKNLLGQSAEKQAEIAQNIQGSKKTQTQLRVESTKFSKVLNVLQGINPPTGAFGDFFQTVVNGLSGIEESFVKFGQGKGFFDFLKSNKGVSQVLQFAGTAVSALGRANSAAQRFAATLGGALTGAGTGAAIGAAVGGPVGAGIGAAAGALIGATVGFISSGNNKKALEAQKRIQRTQEFVNQILAQADSNNLQNLTKNLQAVLKFKSGGGDAFKVKKQAADQLRQAIKQRKQVIEEALKQLGLQNDAVRLQLQVFQDQPIQALEIDRQIKLQELQAETQKALEQFKDSLAVQQQIQESFELQRQLILKTSAEDIIQNVIDEQNKIRELRAQELVDRAKASDDAIGLINAQLQAQLVAIDNDLAAFQGAEEEKTAFLAAKAAERDRIIKDSQKQLDSLLQQGLDILNEGLVVGETKFDNQQKRLRELFGSNLNPFGLIQASGDLLQKSITIAAGAIQFTMEGVADLEGIIAQLNSNPALQAKFMDALNRLVLRTT